MSGILHGVGVGPGDPELLTLRAVRLIAEADVVFCPRGSGGPGRARRAAAAHLAGRRVVELEMEMRGDRASALAAAARTVAREVGGGRGVYLTEGDPSLFSTFRLLAGAIEREGAGLEVVVVPGVSSLTAAAAAAGVPLAMGDETLAVVPASAPLALIEDAIATFDHTVLLKPSMGGELLGRRLAELGALDGSALVVEATGESQEVRRGPGAAASPPPYFSTWLVPGRRRSAECGRVHFVGAGPGSARHLTRRALALLRRADLVVAADSLVAPEVVGLARAGATVVHSSSLALEEVLPPMVEAARAGRVVVRLHSGDPSVYGAVSEQVARLREAGCPYEIVPGVSSAFAVAAALGVELTEPGGAQTVVLTRHGRQVPTPATERLRELAASRATLCVFLSAASAAEVQAELLAGGLAPDTPAAIAHRVSWPDELVVRTTVDRIAAEVRERGLRRHTLILAGEALAPGGRRSRLYDSGHAHVHRGRSRASAPELAAPPALVALTRPGARLARRLERTMRSGRVLVPERLAQPGEELLGRAADRLPALFRDGAPLVLFMAAGAAVRLLAPALGDRTGEPPVVVVDDAGRFAVSLLGGRSAGANRLAEWVAAILGAEAVVTTAAERLGRPALDEAIAARGWRPAAGQRLAAVETAVVEGEPAGFFAPGIRAPAGFDLRRVRSLRGAAELRCGLAVTDREVAELPPGWVLVRPGRLRLGIGCSSVATAAEAVEAALAGLEAAGLAPDGVRQVATIDRRREHPAVLAVAGRLGAEVVAFDAGELGQVAVPSPSEAVLRAVGTPSVAEAAAIRAARGGRLLLPKLVRGRVTVAIAEAPA
jgi:precorrin-4 C11-methyltransferase/precorrin-2 C(20)-methyltransferase